MLDNRSAESEGAPRRRYEDIKAASSAAADRIAEATDRLLATFRGVYVEEYNRPREAAAKLVEST